MIPCHKAASGLLNDSRSQCSWLNWFLYWQLVGRYRYKSNWSEPSSDCDCQFLGEGETYWMLLLLRFANLTNTMRLAWWSWFTHVVIIVKLTKKLLKNLRMPKNCFIRTRHEQKVDVGSCWFFIYEMGLVGPVCSSSSQAPLLSFASFVTIHFPNFFENFNNKLASNSHNNTYSSQTLGKRTKQEAKVKRSQDEIEVADQSCREGTVPA